MIRSIDAATIDFVDGWAAWAQRRGVPLNHVIMADACLFWSIAFVLTYHPTFVGCVAAIDLTIGYIRWANDNGYQKDVRKTLSCNAQSLEFRESGFVLRAFVCAAIYLSIPLDIFLVRILNLVFDLSLFMLIMLNCCRYLGPGDFARERHRCSAMLGQET